MPVFMICAFVLCAYMISLQMLADNPRVGGTPSQRRVLLLAVTGVLLGVLGDHWLHTRAAWGVCILLLMSSFVLRRNGQMRKTA